MSYGTITAQWGWIGTHCCLLPRDLAIHSINSQEGPWQKVIRAVQAELCWTWSHTLSVIGSP